LGGGNFEERARNFVCFLKEGKFRFSFLSFEKRNFLFNFVSFFFAYGKKWILLLKIVDFFGSKFLLVFQKKEEISCLCLFL
jgi:hypothetical protein